RWLAEPLRLALTAACFAALVMTNSWDVVSFGAVWAVAAWWAVTRTGWPPVLGAFIVARWALVPAAFALALAWPFLETLDPNPLGIAPTVDLASDPGRWSLVWLPVLLPSLAALDVLRPRATRRGLVQAAGVLA